MSRIGVILLGFSSVRSDGEGYEAYPSRWATVLDCDMAAMFLDTFLDSESDWYRRESTRLLANGGRLVLICGESPGVGLQSSFGKWLQAYAKFMLLESGVPLTVKCLEPELRPLLENDLAYNQLGFGEWNYLAMAQEDPEVRVAGRLHVDRGEVIVLPFGLPPHGFKEALALIRALPPLDDYPSYLDDLSVGDENALRVEREHLQDRLIEIESELERARKLKRILYVGHHDLEVLVADFLSSELDIPARHVRGVGEDFWLTLDQTDWAIGEVKSSANGNVDKEAVGQLLTHRKERAKPVDFPALLVANTFYKRRALKEREEGIHPDVARRGKEDHILIVRTIDLFRMRNQSKLQTAFLEALRAGGGWFRVGPDLKGTLLP
jgi:hypothetical protein